MPGWSKHAGRYHVPVSARQFRFAVLVLTLLAWVIVGWSALGSSFAGYLVSGYALAMLVNVVFPHLAATFAMRRYAPGTATAVLLNLPVTALCWLGAAVVLAGRDRWPLREQGFAEEKLDPDTFLWAGPLVAITIAMSIPVLFAARASASGPE